MASFDSGFKKNENAKALERMTLHATHDPSQKRFYKTTKDQTKLIYVCPISRPITEDDMDVVAVLKERFPHMGFKLRLWNIGIYHKVNQKALGGLIFISWNNFDLNEVIALNSMYFSIDDTKPYCGLSMHRRDYPYESFDRKTKKVFAPPQRFKKRSKEQRIAPGGSITILFHFFIAEKNKKVSKYTGDKNEITFYFFSKWLKEKTGSLFEFDLPDHLSLNPLIFLAEYKSREEKDIFYNKKENGEVDLEILRRQKFEEEERKRADPNNFQNMSSDSEPSSDGGFVHTDNDDHLEQDSEPNENPTPSDDNENHAESLDHEGLYPNLNLEAQSSSLDSNSKPRRKKRIRRSRRVRRVGLPTEHQLPFWEPQLIYYNTSSDSSSYSTSDFESESDSGSSQNPKSRQRTGYSIF